MTKAYYRSRYAWNSGRDPVWRAIARHLERHVPADGSVLDLGAGYCSFINNVRAEKRHALDSYPEFVHHAGPGVKTHVADCADLGAFATSSLDVVFASNLLEHLTREICAATLREARRALKPDGRLILIQPNFYYAYRNYFDDPTHIQIFTHLGLADLLSASGFIVERLEPRFLPFSFKSRLPAWGWLASLYLCLPYRPWAGQMLIVARPNAESNSAHVE